VYSSADKSYVPGNFMFRTQLHEHGINAVAANSMGTCLATADTAGNVMFHYLEDEPVVFSSLLQNGNSTVTPKKKRPSSAIAASTSTSSNNTSPVESNELEINRKQRKKASK